MLAPATYTRLPAVEEKPMGWGPRTSESKCYANIRGTIGGRDELPSAMRMGRTKTSLRPREPRALLYCQPAQAPLTVANAVPNCMHKCGTESVSLERVLQAISHIALGIRSHIRLGLPRGSATRRLRGAEDGREPRLSDSAINQ